MLEQWIQFILLHIDVQASLLINPQGEDISLLLTLPRMNRVELARETKTGLGNEFQKWSEVDAFPRIKAIPKESRHFLSLVDRNYKRKAAILQSP